MSSESVNNRKPACQKAAHPAHQNHVNQQVPISQGINAPWYTFLTTLTPFPTCINIESYRSLLISRLRLHSVWSLLSRQVPRSRKDHHKILPSLYPPLHYRPYTPPPYRYTRIYSFFSILYGRGRGFWMVEAERWNDCIRGNREWISDGRRDNKKRRPL